MASRADVRTGRYRRDAKPVSTPTLPLKKGHVCSSTCMCSLCTVFWFAIAATFAGLFGWSYTEWKADSWDLSGKGTCIGNTIHVQSAQLWSQYPSTPQVKSVSSIPPQFTGRNAIVWSSTADVQDFKIVGVDNLIVTSDAPLHVQNEECHFTLDSVYGSSNTGPVNFDHHHYRRMLSVITTDHMHRIKGSVEQQSQINSILRHYNVSDIFDSMNMSMIGSQAIKVFTGDDYTPKDLDLICDGEMCATALRERGYDWVHPGLFISKDGRLLDLSHNLSSWVSSSLRCHKIRFHRGVFEAPFERSDKLCEFEEESPFIQKYRDRGYTMVNVHKQAAVHLR